MNDLAKLLTAVGAILFLISEFDKDPNERILLSKESKIVSALGTVVAVL